MLRPEAACENFVQQRFRIVEIHLDLFENYLTFFCHVVGIEERTKTQVGNNIERNGEMIVENFGVEANLFFGGEGVEHSADRIHFTGDGFGGTALRAFEDHVLHEMRDRKSTRLNSSHSQISYAVFCLKKKKINNSVLYILKKKKTSTS